MPPYSFRYRLGLGNCGAGGGRALQEEGVGQEAAVEFEGEAGCAEVGGGSADVVEEGGEG